MEYTEIKYVERNQVAIITFNRPESRNCVGATTHLELIDAWTRFKEDENLKVAILTGAGDQAFCAGGDLKSATGVVKEDIDEIMAHASGNRPGYLGPSRWTDIYKPIIAAINGLAYAGGLEWACFADMRIAEAHATFGVTCRRWNIGLADGGTQRLPRIVGMGRAMELILTGKVIDAEEAYRIGLVNEVVPKGTSLERALALANFICELPQPAMRTDKEAAYRGFGLPLEEGLRIEAECFNRSIWHSETRERLMQFLNKEHPDLDPNQPSKTPGL